MTDEESLRINKAMAKRGLATRREADILIREGLVLVNGELATLGMRVSSQDQITLKRTDVWQREEQEYVAYYKPRGIVTHSPLKHQKDISRVSGFPGLFPVGRLDKESEGLILLTNDGRVTERMLHPRFQHEKEYRVRFTGRFPKNGEDRLLKGIVSDGETLQAQTVQLEDRKHITLVLTEGKKHEVRRMMGALGLEVEALQRTRIMGIHLGALKPGKGRRLTGIAKKEFLKSLGL